VSALTKERETLKTRLNAAEEKYRRQDVDVNELRQELATIQLQYQELTAELGSATPTGSAPSGDLNSSAEQIESTKNAIGELKKQVRICLSFMLYFEASVTASSVRI